MKVNVWQRDDCKTEDIDTMYENYRPAKGPMNYSQFYRPKQFRENKWLLQLLVSAGVLVMLLGLFKLDDPFTGAMKSGVRYLMTAETNVRPALYKIVGLASQVGNVEWPVMDDIPQPATTAITEVPAGTLMILPVSGQIITPFGWSVDPQEQVETFHQGIEIAAPVGTKVKAAADGTVVNIGERDGLGNFVLLKNAGGEMTRYANLSEIAVLKEQVVKAGEIIGKSGVAGDKQPRLYFEVIDDGRPVDPLSRLGVDLTRVTAQNRNDKK